MPRSDPALVPLLDLMNLDRNLRQNEARTGHATMPAEETGGGIQAHAPSTSSCKYRQRNLAKCTGDCYRLDEWVTGQRAGSAQMICVCGAERWVK
jgi:hypothetical protein